jgi:hypothetical protein
MSNVPPSAIEEAPPDAVPFDRLDPTGSLDIRHRISNRDDLPPAACCALVLLVP